MPGPIVHLGAVVQCAHGGVAQPTAPAPRVLVNGMPAVTLASPYVVAGCGLTGSAPPCVTGQFITAATRVLVDGVPVLVTSGQAVCAPSGGPLLILSTEARVTAT